MKAKLMRFARDTGEILQAYEELGIRLFIFVMANFIAPVAAKGGGGGVPVSVLSPLCL